jgi:hypothetical protein
VGRRVADLSRVCIWCIEFSFAFAFTGFYSLGRVLGIFCNWIIGQGRSFGWMGWKGMEGRFAAGEYSFYRRGEVQMN